MCGSIHKGTMYFSYSVTLLSISYSVYQWGNLDKDAEEVLVLHLTYMYFFVFRQGLFINLNLFSSFNDNGFDSHYSGVTLTYS